MMLPINATINTLLISTVCAEFVTLVLNSVSITNNNATGLLAYRTVIMINSNSTSFFRNNTGTDGGGLAMYGESYLVFEENSLLNFTNNKAKHRGGAIFVNTLSAKSPCFYQYVQDTVFQSTKAYFIGNNADTAGTVLFGGNQSCFLFNNPYSDNFYVTFNYSAQTGPSVISSEPTDVCFCDDKQHNKLLSDTANNDSLSRRRDQYLCCHCRTTKWGFSRVDNNRITRLYTCSTGNIQNYSYVLHNHCIQPNICKLLDNNNF